VTKRPYLAGVLGAFFIAFSAILVRVAEVEPATAAVFRCLYALPVLGLIAWRERVKYGPRPLRQRMIAAGAGVFFALDLVFWHNAIAAVGAGLATALGNSQVVFVGLIAWLILRERPEKRALLALPIVAAGLVLISGVIGEGAFGKSPGLGVFYGVLTAITYSGFLLVLRRGNRDIRRPAGPLFDATATTAIGAALIGLAIRDINLTISWPSHGWLALLALESQVAGWLLISISLPRLPAAVTSLLLLVQPVASMLFARILLAETPSGIQVLGVGFILAGIVFANSGRRPSDELLSPDPDQEHDSGHKMEHVGGDVGREKTEAPASPEKDH